ncbi:uncharacterized protein MONOS_12851 [Monocercomonoides exilis]|uniref:uncharacterized protein n=1 Tax=Monocercomonoides exilis TaxID=2049356 RepID=UPI0035597D1A|nr:hypothetical protein MONOS_12851 [Monocercomonoides exilis]|eukprot:MONOS_12851.1-p1 / transcript=MONOS_12851.1 / gene=MONOS_12851 / organism=Monocercomonoides_exilis_PA203 / gene_product=unspecified product / transcript_product=unspecified product / location=Mono_scaffold00742:25342-26185(+) / protein_length=131 / sequence_SO=supercontig / SO=protein_coding / is_pseudo=false
MGCGGSKDKDKGGDSDNTKPIKVESVTFYRSDDTGAPSEPVDGVFYTTVICFRLVHMEGSFGSAMILAPPNYEIVACNLTSLLMNIIDTHAELPRAWPVGEYELRLFINDQLLHQAPFKIVDPSINVGSF